MSDVQGIIRSVGQSQFIIDAGLHVRTPRLTPTEFRERWGAEAAEALEEYLAVERRLRRLSARARSGEIKQQGRQT